MKTINTTPIFSKLEVLTYKGQLEPTEIAWMKGTLNTLALHVEVLQGHIEDLKGELHTANAAINLKESYRKMQADKCDALSSKNHLMREMLKRLEWCSELNGEAHCPCCAAARDYDEQRHSEFCSLGALLKGVKP